MACSPEIIGVSKIGLYTNDNVKFNFPNPSKETEVDLIAYRNGSFIIDSVNENCQWARTIDYSGNYKPNYLDTFSFILHGTTNNVPGILRGLRSNRKGFICEIITKNGDSLVFPTPVFLDERNTKAVNSVSWQVSLSYRVPTFEDYYNKLNTILMTTSYILVGDGSVFGAAPQTIITAE